MGGGSVLKDLNFKAVQRIGAGHAASKQQEGGFKISKEKKEGKS